MIRLLQVGEASSLKCLLDEVTLDLLDRDIPQWEYPWDLNFIRQDIIENSVYGVFKEQQLIGTFSLKDWQDINYFYRLAYSPHFQGNDISQEVIDFIDNLYPKGTKVYLDCYCGNEKLKQYYLNLGFKYIQDLLELDYYISVFCYETRGKGNAENRGD